MSILAAVDGGSGSRAVVERGYELARALGEELYVLNVQPETKEPAEAEQVATDAVRTALDDLEGVTAVGDLDDAAAGILNEAEKRGARYVVLGPRKHTPVGKALMGSVSQLVLLNADCPVTFVPPD